MNKRTVLFFVLAQIANFADASSQKLEFAFLLSRHGARTFDSGALEKGLLQDGEFSKGPGMLTASGMRQRYLKGRYNRQRFASLLSDEYVPGELYI